MLLLKLYKIPNDTILLLTLVQVRIIIKPSGNKTPIKVKLVWALGRGKPKRNQLAVDVPTSSISVQTGVADWFLLGLPLFYF